MTGVQTCALPICRPHVDEADQPGLQWHIGGIFVIAALAALAGLISFVYMRATAPAFFRRQTLSRDTPVRILEMEL